jgi:uncharacterized membrane protein
MSEVTEFLTPEEEAAVVTAIREAEQNTSGEIRVHLEHHADIPCMDRAREVFCELGMNQTELHNGVLFYVGVHDHTFVILGDQGINEKVEPDFWDCTRDIVIEHFKKGAFKDGLVAGILRAGERLKTHFPFDQKGDTNELSDVISIG